MKRPCELCGMLTDLTVGDRLQQTTIAACERCQRFRHFEVERKVDAKRDEKRRREDDERRRRDEDDRFTDAIVGAGVRMGVDLACDLLSDSTTTFDPDPFDGGGGSFGGGGASGDW